MKDLQDASINFINHESRILTLLKLQNSNRLIQVLESKNRWSPSLRWMNGWRTIAQQCSILLESSTAINGCKVQQSSNQLNSSRSCFQNLQWCLWMMNKSRTRQCLWRIWMKKLRENWREISRSEICELCLQNSVRIMIIYALLMMLVNHA